MMIKYFKIFVLFVIIPLSLLSQPKIGTITGSVIDKSNNQPIEGADVTLLRERDSSLVKGASTDAAGKFILSELPPGSFFVRANLVGYNFAVVSGITISRDNPVVNLQPIKLAQGETTTEEITVEREKSLIELRPDKKVFNISKNLTTQGATLLDLLRDIPSVTVDQDGNVSLRGSEAVKITIDGRQSGLEGQNRNIVLEQIPANEVESIELITNPSAKFEAEGSAGIINVVLKKDKQQPLGYNGTVGLNVGTGDKYSGQAGFSLKKDKVNIYGNYNYNLMNGTFNGFSDMFYLNNPSLSQINRQSTGNGRNKSHSVKLGLDYYPDRQNTLGISANLRKSDRTRGGKTFNKEYDLSSNLLTDYFSTSNDFDKDYSLDLNANYMLKFKAPGRVLTADVSYSKDKDDETEQNFDTYILPENSTPDKRNEYSNEIKDDITGKIDYTHPFSKDIKLEAGYRGSYTKRDNDYRVENYDYSLNQYITDFGQSNRFIHRQQVHGLYAIYTQQLGNFGFSLGGRAEQTITKGELVTTNQVFDRSYLNFFPSASISQKITKSAEVQLSFTRRINRPRQRQLNPFRSLMGSNNYSEGNPNLNPEFTDALEFNFVQYFPWATITPGIFYRYTKDEISRTRTLLDSVSTLSTFVNLNKSKSYGGEIIVTSQPAKFINLNGTFSYFRREVDATNLQSGLTNAASTWSARGMSTITLPADLSLQLSYFYSGKRVIANGTIDPFQSFDAAVKKDLFDNKLSITLRASDIFNTAKFVTNFDDIQFREYSERARDSRGLFLNVTYKFGDVDKKQRERKRKENEENEDEDFEY